ncbi:MAG TPA: hypothetical protein VGR06_42225, partial [Actinophytocola sp.]|uniref:hypothetical protein n=1 Tax=Actinophytocola sp. TaxID=1872138 RepID=UPI002DFC8310|nr:hypothetical protein [Actinophytocola sp.]
MSADHAEERVKLSTRRRAIVTLAAAASVAALTVGGTMASVSAKQGSAPFIDGRVIAFGIPGASALSPIGRFLPGSPINSNPELAVLTQPGRVLDPTRIVVGSRSNFGAPKANADQFEGSFLSIDPQGAGLAVPPTFASAGNQASALDGAVQMYSAQSPNWLNGIYSPAAVTANQTGVANPLGMSINNAFGRLWPANAPYGLEGPGSSSITDPDGRPLKGAPNPRTGGVYFGDLTGRQPVQVIPGALSQAAVGTALLGRSPDGTGRAVFAVVVADGSIVQEHTEKALDGIAPPGTVQPLANRSWPARDAGHPERRVLPRLGAIVNYAPHFTLYVSQPFDNSIKAIDVTVGGPTGNEVFMPGAARVIRSAALNQPLDLAPVQIETAHPDHASNTTMQPNTDFYVCNRGNSTIVRMRQDGTVVAVREVRAAHRSLGQARLNGIATSSDGSRIWVTYVGKLPGSS